MTRASDASATTFTLPSDREIQITRTFDAPRALVFKALTDPAAIPNWWGPRRHTTTVDRMDVRPGGAWRFVSRGADGTEFAFHGTYREVEAPGRLVYTFEFEGEPGCISLETITLEERDGRTTMTNIASFHTKADRDGMLESGMQGGATESMDRLGELLAAGSSRAAGLAAKLEAAHDALLAAIARASGTDWRALCTDGVWTKGYAAFHAASNIAGIAWMAQTLANGGGPPSGTANTWEAIDASNAADAREHADCTPAEAIDLVRRDGPAAVAMVRALSDAQLDRVVPPMMDGMPEITVEGFIENALIGHATEHVRTIAGTP